jgi:outer membrane protein
MRKVFAVALAVALCLIFAGQVLAEGKVGFVDFGKVLELTDKGGAVQKKLSAKKDELEIQVQEKELELRKLQEELKTKKDVMAEDVFNQKMQAFQEKLMTYQQFLQESNMTFEKLRIKEIRGLVKDVEDVVAQVAKEKGYYLVIMKFEDVVTNSSLVLYGDASVDLTDHVIKKLNAGQ